MLFSDATADFPTYNSWKKLNYHFANRTNNYRSGAINAANVCVYTQVSEVQFRVGEHFSTATIADVIVTVHIDFDGNQTEVDENLAAFSTTAKLSERELF